MGFLTDRLRQMMPTQERDMPPVPRRYVTVIFHSLNYLNSGMPERIVGGSASMYEWPFEEDPQRGTWVLASHHGAPPRPAIVRDIETTSERDFPVKEVTSRLEVEVAFRDEGDPNALSGFDPKDGYTYRWPFACDPQVGMWALAYDPNGQLRTVVVGKVGRDPSHPYTGPAPELTELLTPDGGGSGNRIPHVEV